MSAVHAAARNITLLGLRCAPSTRLFSLRASTVTRRLLSSQSSSSIRQRSSFPRSRTVVLLRQSPRSPYSDIAPARPRRRLRSVLRWLWRLTYLSLLGGLGVLGYQIYRARWPIEQIDPDPDKKTLVILGVLLDGTWDLVLIE